MDVNGEQINVYGFQNVATAKEAASGIDPSGTELTHTDENEATLTIYADHIIGYPSRYWQQDEFILYYFGQSDDTVALLDATFGERIADASWFTPQIVPDQDSESSNEVYQTVTAVTTSYPRPTVTAAFTSTATPSPTATAKPTLTTVPTPTEAENLAQFATSLEENINNGRFQAIDEQFAHLFYISLIPAVPNNLTVATELEYRYLPPADYRNMRVDLAAAQPPLPDLDGAWWQGEEITAVIPSSGWGPAGMLNGLLVITQEEGKLRWAGLLLSRSGFEAPHWETIAPPPGLIYFFEDGWWQVEADGEPKLLLARDIDLNLSPNATFALRQSGNRAVTSFEISSGISETVELGMTLMGSTSRFIWLDEETAVLIVTEDGPHQQSVGPLILLNARTGQTATLSPEVSIYTQPTIGSNQTIVIDVTQGGQLWTWQNGREQVTKIVGLEQGVDAIYYPALSPDGTKVVGISGGDFWLHRSAFVVVDMAQPTQSILHTYLPIGTDAILPAGITWSPDSQWVALLPSPTLDMESSLWLVSVDGGTKIDLGVSSTNPVWIDAERLAFTAVINRTPEIHLYDLTNNTRFRLDLPQGTTAVQFSATP